MTSVGAIGLICAVVSMWKSARQAELGLVSALLWGHRLDWPMRTSGRVYE